MKRLIDKDGRLFGRINAIDALVLLLALVLIAAFALRAQRLAAAGHETPSASASQDPIPVVYKVTVYNASIGHAEGIQVGDLLYNRDTGGTTVGTIVDMEVSDCRIPSQLADGSYVMARVYDRYNIVLTVEAEVRPIRDGRLFINWGSELGMGLTYNYCTKYCLLTGIVTELECDEAALAAWNAGIQAETDQDGV